MFFRVFLGRNTKKIVSLLSTFFPDFLAHLQKYVSRRDSATSPRHFDQSFFNYELFFCGSVDNELRAKHEQREQSERTTRSE
jgi:hypothetical protein